MKSSRATILQLSKHEPVVNASLRTGLTYTQSLEQMVIALVHIKNKHQNEVIRYIQRYGALEVED
jgi:hypothetical protein